MRSGTQGAAPELRVRLTAEAASVPGARRFVTDGLVEWGRDHLVDDAALCVTEMAANSALHSGSRYMHVQVSALEAAVRVSVRDDGGLVPLPAVAPPPTARTGAASPVAVLGTTGRGLAIVSVLAESWGIEELAEGRRIWADLTGAGVDHAVRPPLVTLQAGEPAEPGPLPSDWVLVRMPGCPVRLGLRVDQRLDDLVRELQLIDSDDGPVPAQELGRLIERLVTRPAFARHMGRRTALEAAAAGLEHVDIEMPLPRDMAPLARELLAADNLADDICERQHLLTPRSTPDMVALRTWMVASMVSQAEHDAAPVPFEEWRAQHG